MTLADLKALAAYKPKAQKKNRTMHLSVDRYVAFQELCRKEGVSVSAVVDAWIAKALKEAGIEAG